MHEISPSELPKSIGGRIRDSRKRQGLSQADLAALVGVSQPAIANWESGIHDPRRLSLAKLAEVLRTPMDWLAAGDRSAVESDKYPAAVYIRRPVQHVPVISLGAALLLAQDMTGDPHTMAEDYIPVTAGSSSLFAVFVEDAAMDLAFPPGTLVVIDYANRIPADGDFCMAVHEKIAIMRRWRANPARFEAVSSDRTIAPISVEPKPLIIGCALLSIRLH